MSGTPQRKIVDVDRGLFLVRYAAADDERAPPSVRLASEARSRDDLRFVLHPDEREPILRWPGTCLILRADARGRLAIDITPSHRDGSVGAKIRIEPLQQADQPTVRHRIAPVEPAQGEGLRIVGHVASRGDVSVEAGTWLAGPAAPSRIEGLTIAWPGKPEGVELRYAVKTARQQPGSGRPVGLGTFAGSRGRAIPIVGVMLEIAGPASDRFDLAAEMVFLGSPVQRMTGRRVEASGPTGREPLVGLRLSVDDHGHREAALYVPSLIREARALEPVRVFRSEHPARRLTA